MESCNRLLVLLAIVYSAVAVPLSRKESCARHCTESNRFQFTTGNTYTYDYETLTTTKVKGTSEERSELQLKAQVDIEVLSKCDLSLRLRSVSLMQSDPQSPDYLRPIRGGREFARTVERSILRFSFQDGVVEDLCPDRDAPAWVTNIQRGILSAFQNSMNNLEGNQRLIETDVGGKCSVEYQSLGRSWRGTLTIRKIKDLNSCTNRQNAETSFQGAPFTHGSSIQSMPLVKGTQECEQSIGNGILQSSACTERHLLRPFSKGGGGATTTVNQKLTFVATSQRSFTGDDYRSTREGLLYNHGNELESVTNSDEEAERALTKLCEASTRDVTINVPGLFASFVYNLRRLDVNSFKSLYRRAESICPSNPKAKKFFLDAVPVVSTQSSINFMAEMISRREIPKSEINFWFTSLSFVSDPTIEMIRTLAPLMDSNYEQSFLGISTLVHSYCTKNDCPKISEVKAVVEQLMSHLGENCNNPDAKKILLTLKAIGNIGIPYGWERTLERCASATQLGTETRIAAIQAFRRFGCEISRDAFLDMYSDYNADSEMRIAAYLATSACLTEDTLQTIKQTLEKERVNQVGSFVWSHLRSMSKSQHPQRQTMKEILSNLYLMNKYESDIRKYSTAREDSFYLDSIDSGLHVDTHLIYPTHSYVPHSAMFNLTVDVFGHSCNLLQLDGRLEGMETVLERFFGPDGYFPQKHVNKLLRNRRSVSERTLERMDQEFDVKSKFEKNLYGSLDMKIFGNTMWYSQFQDNEQDGTSSSLSDFIADLAQKQEKEFSRSIMFLDTTYAIPMASGLPLRLAINGTATVGIKLGGKFNVRSLENIDILANIEPSGAVEMAGLLTIDAGGITRTGMRIAATMHSSTVLDSRMEVRNGQLVKVQLNMPREKIEIIDVQSKLYLVYGTEEREQNVQREPGYHFDSCVGEMSRKVLGLELCTDISLPRGQRDSPMYPMNGGASFSLYLKKTDPKLTSYKFDASWESKTVNDKVIRDAIISVNTPGSLADREVSLKFHYSEQDNVVVAELKSPIKKLGLSAKFANGRYMKKLDISTTVDDRNTFTARSEFRITNEEGGVSYFPSLEIQIPTRTLLSVSGSAHLRHGIKYGGQITIKELTDRPIVLKGNLDIKKRERYEAEVAINSFAVDATTKAFFQMGDTMFFKMNTDYSIMESKLYKLSMNGKVRDLSANALQKYTGVLSMQATAFPEWDTSVSWESMKTTGHIENTFSISVGDGARSRVHNINIQEILRYKGDIHDNNVEVALKFSYPEKRMIYGFDMKHENTDRTLKNEMEIRYSKSKHFATAVSLNLHDKNTVDFSGDLQLSYPGRTSKISAALREERPLNYKGQFNVQWQEGKQIGLTTHYRNKGDDSRIKHEVDVEVTFLNREPVKVSGVFGAEKGRYAVQGDVIRGADRHRLNAEYIRGTGVDHKLSAQLLYDNDIYATDALVQQVRDKFTANLNVKLPNRRRISTKVDVKNSASLITVSTETMWDADRDASKRFGIDGELRTKNSGYDAKINMQVQRRTIRASLSTSREGQLFGRYLRSLYKAEVQWTPTDKVTMSLNTNIVRDNLRQQITSVLDVATLYPGYEAITIKVNHGAGSQQWSSEVTASWADNKMALTTDGKYSTSSNSLTFETNTRLRSPFKNFELMAFNATHYQDQASFTNKMQLQWNRQDKAISDIYASLTNSGLVTGFKVNTPFEPATDVVGEVTFNRGSGNYKTTGSLQWAPTKKIHVAFDVRHVLSGRRRSCNINLIGSSPFQGYETVSSKFAYSNDGTTMNTDMEILYNRNDKITGGFTGTYQSSYYTKNINGKFHFTSPIANYESAQISTSLEMKQDSYKFNLDSQTPYQTSISLNSVGKIESLSNIELNLVFSGKIPLYRNMQRFSFDVVHKLQDSNLRSTLDIGYGRKQFTVLLTGTSKPTSRSANLEGTLTVKTPFRGYEEMQVDATHTQGNWEYLTRIEASRNNKRMLLSQKLEIKDMFNFDGNVHFTSTSNELKITMSQTCYSDQFQHNTNVQWNKKEYMFLTTKYQKKSYRRELFVKSATPWESLKSFSITAEQSSRNNEHKIRVTSQRNDDVINFDSVITNNRYQQVETTMKLTYDVESTRTYQFRAKYDITNQMKTTEIRAEWNHHRVNRAVSLNGNFLMTSENPQIDITLTTPFRGLEKVSLNGEVENQRNRKQATLTYERASVKIAALAKYVTSKNSASFDASFTSPYKMAEDLSLSSKYDTNNYGFSSEGRMQWAHNKRITLTSELSRRERNSQIGITITTPFKDFEKVGLDGNLDISRQKNVASLVLNLGNQKIEISSDCEVRRGKEGTFGVQFSSPFETFKRFEAKSHYKFGSEEYEGDMEISIGDELNYEGQVNYKKGIKTEQFSINFKTPHQPFREVSWVASGTHTVGHYNYKSNIKWENKEISAEFTHKNNANGQMVLFFELNSPFKNFRNFKIDGTLRNSNFQNVEGQLKMKTPFEILPELDVATVYKHDSNNYDGLVSISTTHKILKLTGKVSEFTSKPFSASLEVDAPFTSFKNLELKTNTDFTNIAEVSLKTPQAIHSLTLTYKNAESYFDVELKASSPLLKDDTARFVFKGNFRNLGNVKVETSLDIFGDKHSIDGLYRRQRQNYEVEITVSTPLFTEKHAVFKGSYTNSRQKRTVEGKITYAGSTHHIKTGYGMDSQEVGVEFSMDCDLLPFSTLKSSAKYVNSNSRDIEMSLHVETGDIHHSMVASVKNYDGEKLIQLKVTCPHIPSNEFSVTGTLKNNRMNSMDGVLTVTYPNNEFRVSANMKRNGFESFEGFFTMNTPFESLKMFRVDAGFKNDRYKNIEANVQMESSNPSFRNLAASAKLSRTEGSEDLSLSLRLPNRAINNIQVLGNLHYNPDKTTANARVTLSLPQKRYSMYGNYALGESELAADGELEWLNKKWAATGHMDFQENSRGISVVVTLPNRHIYEAACSYGTTRWNRNLVISYNDPNNRMLKINTTVTYVSMANIEVSINAAMPFSCCRNIDSRFRHHTTSETQYDHFEYTVNSQKGFASYSHRTNSSNSFLSSFTMGSPFKVMKDMRIVLMKKSDNEISLEVNHNHENKVKLQKTTTREATVYKMEYPSMPYVLKMELLPLRGGRKIKLTSIHPTQRINFMTGYYVLPMDFMHEMLLNWGPQAEMKFSNYIRVTNIDNNQMNGKEFFGKVAFPTRSFELKGRLGRSGRVQSGGVDFFWDADRSPEKNITFGIEHQDLSSRNEISHKVQMIFKHPYLQKELVQSNTLVITSKEFKAQTELQYSPRHEHHFVAELAASDLSRKSRNTHYKAEYGMRHIASKLDLKVIGELVNTPEEASAHIRINNADRNGRPNVPEIKAKIMKLRKEIEVIMSTSQNAVTLSGRMSTRSHRYNFGLVQKLNGVKGFQSTIKFDSNMRSLDMNMTVGDNRGVHLSATFPDDSINLKLSHTTEISTTTDCFLFVGLEKARILKSRINWRPGMWRDFRIATGDTVRAVFESANRGYAAVSNELMAEWQDKIAAAKQSLITEFDPLLKSTQRELVTLQQDFNDASKYLSTMYKNNAFYSKDIVREVREMYKSFKSFCGTASVVLEALTNTMLEFLEDTWDSIYIMYEDCVEYTSRRYSQMKKEFSKWYSRNLDRMSDVWNSVCKSTKRASRRVGVAFANAANKVAQRMEVWMKHYAPFMIDTYYNLRIFTDRIRETTNYYGNRMAEKISKHPLYAAVSDYWTEIVATVEAFQLSDITNSVQSRVLFMGERAGTFINKLSDGQLLDLIRNRIPVEYVSTVTRVTLQKGMALYETMGLNRVLNAFVDYGVEHFKEVILSSGHEMLTQFYQMRNGFKYTFEPKNGLFAFEYSLPSSSNNIYEIFNFAKYAEYQRLIEAKDAIINKYYEDFCIWDIYYSIKKFFSPREWLPPFTAHAMIAGNQHYVTFDKFAFDFAGECSYLLARDFMDGKFSVVANYKRDGARVVKKSLTVLTDAIKLEVAHDYKVTLDDVMIELPVKVGNTVVIREGSVIRIENEKHQFNVICNFVHDVCTVGMSGYYFGKTGGLFGTYDYEPRLDVMTPKMTLASDIESFANSWEVGQASCRRTGNMATVPGNDYHAQQKCRELFQSSASSFRACFKQVDPEPFYKMCISDLSAVEESRFDSVLCVSSAAYFTECKIHGVQLKMPKSCVRCETDTTPMSEGDVAKFPGDVPSKTADVVFLVEEKKCNEENLKFLGKLIRSVEDSFRSQGFQDVRYRFVGFGGDNIHSDPHIHTIDGREYVGVRAAESDFKSFELGNGPANVFEALRFAASLNYHPGSSKSFVLMKCSACEADENRVAYGEVLRTLIDGEISLHLLMEQKYEMKTSKNTKAKKVIGIDKDVAYSIKDMKDPNYFGDRDLLVQLKVPKDICIPLALEVNGSTFDSQYLTETKKNTYKKFVDTLARRIVHSAKQRSEWTMCCECIANSDGVGRTTCQRCVSPQMVNMITTDNDSMAQKSKFQPRERRGGKN